MLGHGDFSKNLLAIPNDYAPDSRDIFSERFNFVFAKIPCLLDEQALKRQ